MTVAIQEDAAIRAHDELEEYDRESTKSISVRSAMVSGAEAMEIVCEVSTSRGIPGISIVGMPDASVRESSLRVRSALRSSGFSLPRLAITVNLAPSDVRKSGTGFDLPIAVAILAISGQIPRKSLDKYLFVGELGLDGSVCEVRGLVAHALLAQRMGLSLVCASPAELLPTDDPTCRITSLKDVRQGVEGISCKLEAFDTSPGKEASALDFSQVYGQELAKRALVIAAAGMHGVLMVGPPGAGKSMLAKRLPGILPQLDQDEILEALLIHSVAGQPMSMGELAHGDFRAPHHSASKVALVGGGRPVRPGEISLAHRGVLFLDEMPEFPRDILDCLRQPIEDGWVRIARSEGVFEFPSRFMLLAAANPCPCGYLGDPQHSCKCSEGAIMRYRAKLCGPLADRVDIQLSVARPDAKVLIEGSKGLSTADMAQQVLQAREFTDWRVRNRGTDRHTPIRQRDFARDASDHLEFLSRRLGYGGRGIEKVARVARTIADLAKHELVQVEDVTEASGYRPQVG